MRNTGRVLLESVMVVVYEKGDDERGMRERAGRNKSLPKERC